MSLCLWYGSCGSHTRVRWVKIYVRFNIRIIFDTLDIKRENRASHCSPPSTICLQTVKKINCVQFNVFQENMWRSETVFDPSSKKYKYQRGWMLSIAMIARLLFICCCNCIYLQGFVFLLTRGTRRMIITHLIN